MIIGLCGTSILGRAEVATLLISKGFAYYSPLLEIDQEARKQGNKKGESMRKADGSKKIGKNIYIKKILDRISEENVVIDSITSPKELEILRTRQDFLLVGIYSPLEIKFQRSVAQEILAYEKGEKRKEATEELTELSNLMNQLDFSIVYPTHTFGLNVKVDEIIKKGKKTTA